MLHDNREFIRTDRRGWPKISGIHDARLTALSVEFGSRLAFDALGANGEKTSFVLDGLRMLNIESLWEGLIIESVAIWPVTQTGPELCDERCSNAWSALLAGRNYPENRTSEIARLQRKYDGSALIAVSSSYGGELQALCQDVSINGAEWYPYSKPA